MDAFLRSAGLQKVTKKVPSMPWDWNICLQYAYIGLGSTTPNVCKYAIHGVSGICEHQKGAGL